MTKLSTFPAAIAALAACPSMRTLNLVQPVLLTATRSSRRRSKGRADSQPAGSVRAITASKDGAKPAGWGIVPAAGRKVRDDPDADWMIAYDIVAPRTEDEADMVIRAAAHRRRHLAGISGRQSSRLRPHDRPRRHRRDGGLT